MMMDNYRGKLSNFLVQAAVKEKITGSQCGVMSYEFERARRKEFRIGTKMVITMRHICRKRLAVLVHEMNFAEHKACLMFLRCCKKSRKPGGPVLFRRSNHRLSG